MIVTGVPTGLGDNAPMYSQAIVLQALSFPAWILCLSPLYWHWRQGNVAAASLITWVTVWMFFASINSVLWPRDNVEQWWDGRGWCDISIRVQLGTRVALPACVTMILHKLVKVMDTRNMTVSTSKNSQRWANFWSIVWCWLYPVVIIALYDICQSYRYYIFGIRGCWAGYWTGWPGIVLNTMWGPLTMFAAGYYALVLIYRLHRYRREFSHLITARNTTRAKFMRLFVMSMIAVVIYLPFSAWQLRKSCKLAFEGSFDWDEAHALRNTVFKMPSFGQTGIDGWVSIFSCYIIFIVFGIGTEANDQYRQMLVAIGLGKVFSSLYINNSESGTHTPTSFVRSFRSRLSSTAKSVFPGKSVDFGTIDERTRNGSLPVNPVLMSTPVEPPSRAKPTFLRRIFSRKPSDEISFVLPVWNNSATPVINTVESPGKPIVQAHAWAAHPAGKERLSEADGVRVVREFSHECTEDGITQAEKVGYASKLE